MELAVIIELYNYFLFMKNYMDFNCFVILLKNLDCRQNSEYYFMDNINSMKP
jgi:hypothetical protein